MDTNTKDKVTRVTTHAGDKNYWVLDDGTSLFLGGLRCHDAIAEVAWKLGPMEEWVLIVDEDVYRTLGKELLHSHEYVNRADHRCMRVPVDGGSVFVTTDKLRLPGAR